MEQKYFKIEASEIFTKTFYVRASSAEEAQSLIDMRLREEEISCYANYEEYNTEINKCDEVVKDDIAPHKRVLIPYDDETGEDSIVVSE